MNLNGHLSHLFPTYHAAYECVLYLQRHALPPSSSTCDFGVWITRIPLDHHIRTTVAQDILEVYIVPFPPDLKKLGKSFWQHTGMGITSRYAEACLANINYPDVCCDRVLVEDTRVRSISWTFNYKILICAQGGSSVEMCSDVERVACILQQRIASFISSGKLPPPTSGVVLTNGHTQSQVSASDVFLYPSGMSAIWHAHQLVMALKPGLVSVCFG